MVHVNRLEKDDLVLGWGKDLLGDGSEMGVQAGGAGVSGASHLSLTHSHTHTHTNTGEGGDLLRDGLVAQHFPTSG